MPITNASRIQAAAEVQNMVGRIQTSRAPPNILGDLSPEQKQSVKEQMNQMMPMFMKLDQLMPFFFALTGNREATARLILMKYMFQDQLDSLKHEQYTITPENLGRLKDRLQYYFIWVKTEMASANPTSPAAQAPGNVAHMAQPSALGAAPTQPANSGAMEGMNASVAADVTGVNGIGSTATTTYTSAPTDPTTIPTNHSTPILATAPAATAPAAPPSAQGVPGMVVKVGLTPADLKLPPSKKTNNSPPNSSFPGSPRSEAGTPSTPNLGLARPGAPGNNHGSTPKHGKAVPSTPAAPLVDQQPSSTLAAQETVSPTISKAADGSSMTSSQLLLKSRQLQQQQALIQQQQQQKQQQQQQQQQLVPQITQLQQNQQQNQQQSQQLVPQQPGLSTTPQQQYSPLTLPANSPARQVATQLESLSKEELIRQFQVFKTALSGAPLPPKQAMMVKAQLQRIQAELTKPHRQEQMPRLGDVPPSNGISGNPGASTLPTTTAVSPSDHQLSGTSAPTQAAAADLGPQIRELQMQENKVGPIWPVWMTQVRYRMAQETLHRYFEMPLKALLGSG
ncbi:mediator complex subunit [Mortierella sp. GBA39]|nr:mediator complex subunit [Mortierella sp. GBA39]